MCLNIGCLQHQFHLIVLHDPFFCSPILWFHIRKFNRLYGLGNCEIKQPKAFGDKDKFGNGQLMLAASGHTSNGGIWHRRLPWKPERVLSAIGYTNAESFWGQRLLWNGQRILAVCGRPYKYPIKERLENAVLRRKNKCVRHLEAKITFRLSAINGCFLFFP